MIRSKVPMLTSVILLGGSFLMLTLPNWMAYTSLLIMVAFLAIYTLYKNSQILPEVWTFIVEFVGFCMLVLFFITALVMMNHVLTP